MSKRLIYGVGINDADYVIQVCVTVGYVDGKQKQKRVWTCPFYQTWTNMLERGHSDKYKINQPTYKDCKVCKEWHLFSTFKAWMETQPWEGNHLDKDLLINGNKVYSPEACVFVSRQVNNFIAGRVNTIRELAGVSWHKQTSKFMARCSNPFTKKPEHLGLFTSELEAHQAWLKRKLEHAYAIAATQTDERVAKALIDRYENY